VTRRGLNPDAWEADIAGATVRAPLMHPDSYRLQPDDFHSASREFVRIEAYEEGERALVEGSIAIPGLPVCRIRMRADADRLCRYGAGRDALFRYIREALREDALSELPCN